MNLINFWKLIFTAQDKSIKVSAKPTVKQAFVAYVIPLSLITPIMLAYTAQHNPKPFLDKLPSDSLYMVGFAVFVMEVISIPTLAFTLKNLAEMVNIKPTFQDSFLIVAYAATPAFLISISYLIPSFSINVALHGLAALAACLIIYKGIKNIFRLQARGARFMLTMATVATAATGFAIVLVITLILWGKAL